MKIKAQGSSFVRRTIQTIILPVACVLLGNVLAHADTFVLGTTNLWEGPTAGADSIVLGASATNSAWTNTANDAWLHLNAGNASGKGSTNIVFSFDANTGDTRTGTLTIAGQMVNVTQAGATYVPAPAMVSARSSTNLLPMNPAWSNTFGLYRPMSASVDGAGNVYIDDFQTLKMVPPSLTNAVGISLSGLGTVLAFASDSQGNLYIANSSSNNQIAYAPVGATNLVTLVSNPWNGSCGGLAVDPSGNIYFSDWYYNSLKCWTASNGILTTIITNGLNHPEGLAADAAGNIYIADNGNAAIKKWTASTHSISTLYTTTNYNPTNVVVDGSGNIYFLAGSNNSFVKISGVDRSVSIITYRGFSLGLADTLAVDSYQNVYVLDVDPYSLFGPGIYFVPHAFVNTAPVSEGLGAGSDQLPPIIPPSPATQAWLPPQCNQPWLTVNGVTNGVVIFSFPSDPGSNRTGHITVLGCVTQIGQFNVPSYTWAAQSWIEPPTAGMDSITLVVQPEYAAWTITTTAPWLHLVGNPNGAGSTNVIFTFDANPGLIRTGNLVVGGQTFTVMQAGSSYVSAGTLTTLVSTNLAAYTVNLDSNGNLLIPSLQQTNIHEWVRASNQLITFQTNLPALPCYQITEDALGDYYMEMGNNIYELDTNSNVSQLYNAKYATSVLVDPGGNLCFFRGEPGVPVSTWPDNALVRAVSGTSTPVEVIYGFQDMAAPLSADAAGNLYLFGPQIHPSGPPYLGVEVWHQANNSVSFLTTNQIQGPEALAVDPGGNVFMAFGGGGVQEWSPRTGVFTNALPSLSFARALTFDGEGNLYIVANSIMELPRVFVDSTARFEAYGAGSDSLSTVLPSDADLLPPFAPTTDQIWLSVTSATNGVVSFAFTANAAYTNRTAHINLFGQSIAVTQSASLAPPQITGTTLTGTGMFQFSFSNNIAGSSFTVLSTTNLFLPVTNWTAVGVFSNAAAGQLQFSIPVSTNEPERFYSVRSP